MATSNQMQSFEHFFRGKGFVRIAGIDEAGRGPLAGPVVAACVVLPPNYYSPDVRDSKQLSAKKREKVYWEIIACARVGVGIIDEKKIDSINILQASLLAMRKALVALSATPDVVLIDGLFPLKNIPVEQVPIAGGDGKSISIAAASIVAKVTRDHIMEHYDVQFPQYHFSKHKGYPTAEHIDILRRHGPSPIHRFSFAPVAKLAVRR